VAAPLRNGDRVQIVAGDACPCVEYHLNKVMHGDAQCVHTRGERPAETAKVFDARANALAARAAVRASRPTGQGPAETVPAVDAPGTAAQ
jgi:predicted nucleic acid-binding Zn finger protein